MFSGIWAKITGAMTVAIGFLLFVLKIKNKKIEELEIKDRVNEKRNERRENQEKLTEEIFENEKESIDKKVKSKPVSSSDDYLDGL